MLAVLITGATSGIGYELAKIFAKNKFNLFLVSRNAEKLNLIKSDFENNFGIKVIILAKDLSFPQSSMEVYQFAKNNNIDVEILVNNSGFGHWGNFFQTEIEKENRMLNLNINALTLMTKYFLPDMVKNKKGKIMNVASVAGFFPGPFMSVYYATKSYVISFSEAIKAELKDSGVTVTTLCPGPTFTEFEKNAELQDSDLFKLLKPASADKVAQYGYKALMAGKGIAIYGILNKCMIFMKRLVPNSVILKVLKKIQGRTKIKT
jgi:short-subunit dehydrogenase